MSRTLAALLLAGVTLTSIALWLDQAIVKPFRDLLVDTGDADPMASPAPVGQP